MHVLLDKVGNMVTRFFLVIQAAQLATKRKMAPGKIKKMYVLAGLLVSEAKLTSHQ